MADEVANAPQAPEYNSTLDGLLSMGFSILGDSRDFSAGSVQMTLGRGNERITWIFPMKKAVVGVDSPQGSTLLQAPVETISFDVLTPRKKS